MFRYLKFSSGGTGREQLSHSAGELFHELPIEFLSPDGFSLSPPLSNLTVGKALLFRLFQGLLFDQQPLPFIPFPGAAPFQHHRRQRRMLPPAPGQRHIS